MQEMKTHAEILHRKARFIKTLRAYFEMRDYLEVFTDQIVPAGAFESSLDPLSLELQDKPMQLHTSPEIEMKRILSVVKAPIFQICKCFRDDPDTGVHRPEFTMLEFYQVGTDYRAVLSETLDIIKQFTNSPPNEAHFTFFELFQKFAEVDLSTSRTRDALAKKNHIETEPNDSWEDIVFKLLVQVVEPRLEGDKLTVVYDYPASMAALAKTKGETAERFEVYWKGMEICNGCTELISAEDMKQRYHLESENRLAEGKEPHPVPTRLFNALENTPPPQAGVAIGLDRLFAALYGVPVSAFSRSEPLR